MAFLEDLGKKLTDAGQGVAQSTKNFTELNRLNSAVSDKERSLTQLYASLGQMYYDAHNRDPEAEGASIVGQITALREEIDQCQEEIKRIKGMGKCPSCGGDVARGAAFCPACGGAIPQEPAPAVDAQQSPPKTQRLCPSCGRAVNEGNKFCNFCGGKME